MAGQVLAQAAPNATANGGSAANQAPDDRAKRPRKHREVRRGPVKPPHYPSNPQPPVSTRR